MSAPIETAPKVCFCGGAIRKRTSESFIRYRERKFCSSKCNRAAQVAARDLSGTTFGKCEILERLPGRDEYELPTWRARHHCGFEQTLSSKQLSSCRSKACEPKCESCGTRAALSECGLCRQMGHAAAVCPKRKTGEAKSTCICAGLTHRVIGPKCRGCGLRYKDEAPVELEDCMHSHMGRVADLGGAT
jgi:hypothetical protein